MLLFDGSVFVAAWTTSSVVYRANVHYGMDRPIPEATDLLSQTVPSVIAMALVVILPAAVGPGASLGQRSMLAPRDPPGLPGRRWVGMLNGFGAYALVTVVETAPGIIDSQAGNSFTVVARVLILANVTAVVFDRAGRGLSFRVARAELVESRSTAGGPGPPPSRRVGIES